MQRFKAALPTGNYPGNPEDLVRDPNGEFVKYGDMQQRLKSLVGEWRAEGAFLDNPHDSSGDRAVGQVYKRNADALEEILNS